MEPGDGIDLAALAPNAPRITGVETAVEGTGDAAGLRVLFAPGTGTVPPVTMRVEHKLAAAATFRWCDRGGFRCRWPLWRGGTPPKPSGDVATISGAIPEIGVNVSTVLETSGASAWFSDPDTDDSKVVRIDVAGAADTVIDWTVKIPNMLVTVWDVLSTIV